MTKEAAHEASLSKKFGLGPFPFHTDTAHWAIPGRYLILACLYTGRDGALTRVVDRTQIQLSEVELEAARSAVFFVRNGRHSFFSSIFATDGSFIRFDPGCMEPTDDVASQVIRSFSIERPGVSGAPNHVAPRNGCRSR
jgi:hypothetical protein